eukprot:9501432-Pyramimonas_sp.AAC.1
MFGWYATNVLLSCVLALNLSTTRMPIFKLYSGKTVTGGSKVWMSFARDRDTSGTCSPANGPIIRRKHGYILTTDQSYAGSAGIFSRRTNHTQKARVTTDQSYAGSAGTFSRRTNHTQEARVYFHDGRVARKRHRRDETRQQG